MNVIACSIDIGSYLRDVSTASAIERITAKTGRWMLARLDHPKRNLLAVASETPASG